MSFENNFFFMNMKPQENGGSIGNSTRPAMSTQNSTTGFSFMNPQPQQAQQPQFFQQPSAPAGSPQPMGTPESQNVGGCPVMRMGSGSLYDQNGQLGNFAIPDGHPAVNNPPLFLSKDSQVTIQVGRMANHNQGGENDEVSKAKNNGGKEEQPFSSLGISKNAPNFPKGSAMLLEQDSATSFRNRHIDMSKTLFETVRKECKRVEDAIRESESQVTRKEDEAFIVQRNEIELNSLVTQQNAEVKRKKEAFENMIGARMSRKKSKLILRRMACETKLRDKKILQQDMASKIASEVKASVTDKRLAFDAAMDHMERRHEKQRKQLAASQERIICYEKLLNDLETRHLKEEIRGALMKKFQEKLNHQKVFDKRVGEHLREIQRLEIKHSKERFEVEMSTFEDLQNFRAHHVAKMDELEASQIQEINSEKERLMTLKEQLKVMSLGQIHNGEMKALIQHQREQLKRIKQSHRERLQATRSGVASKVGSRGASSHASNMGSRSSSTEDVNEFTTKNTITALSRAMEDLKMRNAENYNMNDQEAIQEQLQRMEDNLKTLMVRHKESRAQLATLQCEDIETREKAAMERVRELLADHETEMLTMRKSHEIEVAELLKTQEREVQLQQTIYDAECKALLERRMLNSVLDTVVDGIINIDPVGTVSRFNFAAEKMFGYSAAEVIGKNIKMLMPSKFADNHDNYLKAYMTTGVKKVIGTGRRLYGRRKDGSEFPVYLSVSEVKEDGAHIFTGIVRDLTSEVESESSSKALEIAKQKELEQIVTELDRYKAQADELIAHLLPPTVAQHLMKGLSVPPQSFESATVFFSDIVGFTELSSQSTPFQIVALLNDLYTAFDSIISKYDAYKVETIGDAYMVVSGVPNPNGRRHASETATMALELLSCVYKFTISHIPDRTLKIRIGLNTGPVVAGVVGAKMPRYCLFGETVAIASKMESTGQPLRIQLSEPTFEALSKVGGFKMALRGEVEVKGKGMMKTYWLSGKEGFGHELPPLQ